MKSEVISRFNGGSRTISRARWNHLLPAAGLACFGLTLAGCGASSPAPGGSAQTTRYTIQDLGVVGTNVNDPGQPFVISNNGWIAGGSGIGAAEHAAVWNGPQGFDLGSPGLGGNSIAFGVNDSGLAVGEAESTAGNAATMEDFCGFQAMGYSSSPVPCVPFSFWQSEMTPLKTLGGANGVANQVNSSGAIAGYAENKTVDQGCPAPQLYQFKPVVWSGGSIQQLPTGGDPEGVAFSINGMGQVAGTSGSCGQFNPVWLFNLNPVHAQLWQNGTATDLGNLGGVLNNIAHSINNLGQVVGGSDLAGDLTSHAFSWTAATKMQDLGTVIDAVDKDAYSFGLGINDSGQIVGISASADFSILRAFIQQKNKLVDLNSLVTGTTPLDLLTACSINSMGEIIGLGFDPKTGYIHAYLASPTSVAGPAESNPNKPAVLPDWVRRKLRFAMPR